MNRFLACAFATSVIAGCASQAPKGIAIDPSQPSIAQAADPLVRQLESGGYVMYFRHGKTEQAFQDQPSKQNWWKSCDPRSSRPLSDEGRQQMLSIGAQMRELRIPVAK